ncbi:hypothetical protein HMI54_000972 [Coelomomyces lativittatus]|nr:hypothetical protein HMI56_001566 [Coelomomyces lativittatus]KAJ1517441.1 hypothetical protein HMI55_007060 [Coelomomyces lativittatus]KAJ1518386.1 hypothetical protein HMI54_000972 [Coelomomyces lativittatus]
MSSNQLTVQNLDKSSEWSSGMSLWGLDSFDGNIDQKYQFKLSGKGPVNVYVLDSGTEIGHPGFKSGQVEFMYTAPNVEKSNVNDCTGHGSHVSGIIAGTVTGVAKNAKIYVLRISGCGPTFNNQNIIDALNFLTSRIQKPAVVNLGLLPLSSSSVEVEKLKNLLVKFVNEVQVPVVMAAGDESTPNCSRLAQIDGLISVGAHDEQFSPLVNSNYGSCTNVFAPGNNIWSHSNQTGGIFYSRNSGTSSASAFVSGAVATLLEFNKNLSPAEVQRELVKNSVRNLTDKTNTQQPIVRVYTPPNDGGDISSLLTWLLPSIFGVLLLLAIGGFIFWRLRRRSRLPKSSITAYNPSENAVPIRFSNVDDSQYMTTYSKSSMVQLSPMQTMYSDYEVHNVRESYIQPTKYKASTLHSLR